MGTGVTTSICSPEKTQVTYSPTCACVFDKQFVVDLMAACCAADGFHQTAIPSLIPLKREG